MRIYLRWQRKRVSRFLRISVCALALSSLVIYIIFPIVFRYSTYLQWHFIFENDVSLSKGTNFSNPAKENLIGALNRYIQSEDGITLGVWQILPIELATFLPPLLEQEKDKWFLEKLGNGKPIFLYCHGNTPSRATHHRVLLYQVLQKMNFHILTFDYRGFADSTRVDLSEDGVVEDTIKIISWIRRHSVSSLYLWGHSLGTGIAAKASAQLCKLDQCPDALILQSPFTSIRSMLSSSKLTLPFRILPWFNFMFISPLMEQGLMFDTEKNIRSVDCPLLILHAKDDAVVPFSMAESLYNIARDTKKIVKFVSFDKEANYGHNFICRAPDLPNIVRYFLKETSAAVSSFREK